MKKKIVRTEYKRVKPSSDGDGMGGSGLGVMVTIYVCSCKKKVPASIWKLHKHK